MERAIQCYFCNQVLADDTYGLCPHCGGNLALSKAVFLEGGKTYDHNPNSYFLDGGNSYCPGRSMSYFQDGGVTMRDDFGDIFDPDELDEYEELPEVPEEIPARAPIRRQEPNPHWIELGTPGVFVAMNNAFRKWRNL